MSERLDINTKMGLWTRIAELEKMVEEKSERVRVLETDRKGMMKSTDLYVFIERFADNGNYSHTAVVRLNDGFEIVEDIEGVELFEFRIATLCKRVAVLEDGGKQRIFKLLKAPFRYDDYGQMIFDGNGNLVLDVRMWGMLQRESDGQKLQNDFGRMIAEILTSIALNGGKEEG